ncbi:MAG: DUF4038 domain-containing protein [Verrucomicrobia bacterium]|nr:DUF4038 domain-containing protein [Verrucomicrobiota bacterium]
MIRHLLFASFSLALLQSLEAAPAAVSFTQSATTVEAFDFVEVTLNLAEPDAANPFTEVAVTGEFAREGGVRLNVDGFCDAADGSVFRIRFMPAAAGRHTFSVRYRQGDYERSHTGSFTARDGQRRGQLRVDPEFPEHFVWAGTGEHYFWNGTTTYYLMGWEDDAVIRQTIDRLAALKINRLRVLVYGRNEDRPWGQPVKSTPQFKLYLNPWPAARPDDVKNPGFDLKRFNVAFWQKYERMLRHARERDVIVSVIFFIGGQVLPAPFAAYSADEQRYYRYGVARLAAFSNVTWDLGNEHDFHREFPKWCDWLGPLVKEWDPCKHLLSAHNKIYRTPGRTWNDLQLIQRWDGGQNAFMLGERAKQAATGRVIPQINEEYGYEDLWEKTPGQRAADTRRRCAWEIAMAGCYQTAGETANRGVGFPPDTGGGWVSGRGDAAMTMLCGYAHMVDFFTSFEWWRLAPRNDLVRGGAFCLAETGKLYAVYLPRPASISLTLAPGNYHACWFNPRSGQWTEAPVASGPRWLSPAPAGDGDWALLLRRDPKLRDTTPPMPVGATASLARNEVVIGFTKALDPRSVAADRFTLEPAVRILAAKAGADLNTVVLSTSGLADGVRYTLTVRELQDQSTPPNRLTTPARVAFDAQDALRPIAELRFKEGRGETTANTGTSAHAHPTLALTDKQLAWTTNTPPGGGAAALDFGSTPADRAVELTGDLVAALKGLKSFTLSGWINCRSAQVGSGGNRIVSAINQGGDGFDLVMTGDGRLQLGVNQWPDGSPARSSARQIPAQPGAPAANWRFFAVTYDATRSPAEVKFYFGTPERQAALDATVAYDRGPVGEDLGPLAVGHFNRLTRPEAADRMFRGVLDEIRVHGSALDGTGALTLEQIRALQGPTKPAVAPATPPAAPGAQSPPPRAVPLPELCVSENRRFLMQANGQPFFYLGDTAWELFHRLNREEADRYLANRARHGFTVIQAVVVAELDGLRTPNAYGHLPFHDFDSRRPNEEYFAHVDYIVDRASELGLRIGMLPSWGRYVAGADAGRPDADFFNAENAADYGRFLARRYGNKPVIWVLGGDRLADNTAAVWTAMAQGIREVVGQRQLITFHPRGGASSSRWFHQTDWLDFNMLQSGHSAQSVNYVPVERDYALQPPKPTFDGEPAYEYPPDALPPKRPVGALQVRRNAYWAVFAGAFGHTYGTHPIWQMYDTGRKPLWEVVTPWHQALDLPGAMQLIHLKRLMLSRPFLTRLPDQSVITPPVPDGAARIQATRDGQTGQDDATYLMAYFPEHQRVTVNTGRIAAAKLRGWWFNPRTGEATPLGEWVNTKSQEFKPPTRAAGEDWVLVLDDAARVYPTPGQP